MNNFKSILESIQDLTQLNIVVPSWFESVFLGYDNDMSSSYYENMSIQLKSLDFRDTFLNWDHLQESFPTKVRQSQVLTDIKKIVPVRKSVQGCPPPYVLKSKSIAKQKPRKRAKTDNANEEEEQVFEVDTYTLPYMGPYPSDAIRVNSIRYTPTQGTPPIIPNLFQSKQLMLEVDLD
jgi:intron-binding protein aquarius